MSDRFDPVTLARLHDEARGLLLDDWTRHLPGDPDLGAAPVRDWLKRLVPEYQDSAS